MLHPVVIFSKEAAATCSHILFNRREAGYERLWRFSELSSGLAEDLHLTKEDSQKETSFICLSAS